MGIRGRWGGAELEIGDAGATDGSGVETSVWGDTDPAKAIAGTRVGLGFGPLGPNVASELETAVYDAGLDWEADWEPSVFSYYMGFAKSSGANLGADAQDYGYAFASQVDASMNIMTDDDGKLITQEIGGDTMLPPRSFLSGRAWLAVDPSVFE
jgi:hypothetical protein